MSGRTTKLSSREPLSHRTAAASSVGGMTAVEIAVVVAIVLVLTSVLSFGIYNIIEDSKRQVATLETAVPGEQMFVVDVSRSPVSQAAGLTGTAAGETAMDPRKYTSQSTTQVPVYAGFHITAHAADSE